MMLEEVMQEGDHCVSSFSHVRCLINEFVFTIPRMGPLREVRTAPANEFFCKRHRVRHRFCTLHVARSSLQTCQKVVYATAGRGTERLLALVEGPPDLLVSAGW
ncbi:hypothetical protein GBAR_LOCUS27661 [Geodia barretti]|nr:hypothetical protein GBAR_LOCUS27661 [Geodia barretti]